MIQLIWWKTNVQKNVVISPALVGKYTHNILLGKKENVVEHMHGRLNIYFKS